MKDIRTLDLNLLRVLDALLDERSVTRAAERLGFTQPAVSGMLTRLREGLHDPTFVRTQPGLVPAAAPGVGRRQTFGDCLGELDNIAAGDGASLQAFPERSPIQDTHHDEAPPPPPVEHVDALSISV